MQQPSIQQTTDCGTITVEGRQRLLLMTVRQALIMVLNAIEDYLGLEHSTVKRIR